MNPGGDLGVSIEQWSDIESRDALLPGIDGVFFASSNTQSFASEEARAVFRERWLGRYLTHDPAWAFVALDRERNVLGYLAGSLDDPALTPPLSRSWPTSPVERGRCRAVMTR